MKRGKSSHISKLCSPSGNTEHAIHERFKITRFNLNVYVDVRDYVLYGF